MFVNAALVLLVRVRLGRHTCMLWLYLTCSLVACVVCGTPSIGAHFVGIITHQRKLVVPLAVFFFQYSLPICFSSGILLFCEQAAVGSLALPGCTAIAVLQR